MNKQLMIQQGYIPSSCTLNETLAPLLVMAEIKEGRSPCDGCNADRGVCAGTPKFDREAYITNQLAMDYADERARSKERDQYPPDQKLDCDPDEDLMTDVKGW